MWRAIKKLLTPQDVIFIGWFVIVALFIVFGTKPVPERWFYFWVNVVLVSVFLAFFLFVRRPRRRLLNFFRYYYPVLMFLFMYEETGRLNMLFHTHLLDDVVIKWEMTFLGFQPAVMFHRVFHWAIFSEYMHLAYFSYFFLLSLIPLYFYIKGRYREFFETIFITSVVFYVCYLIFIIFPVAGPRVAIPGLNNDPRLGYIFVWIMGKIYAVGEIAGGAFPSSHCAVATVILIATFRHIGSRWFRVAMLVDVVSLYASTVYGRYHYVVDVIAGIAVGAFCYYIALWFLDRMHLWGFASMVFPESGKMRK